MTDKQDTPRTDKHIADFGADGLADGDFCRQLERELDALRAKLAAVMAERDKALEDAAKVCESQGRASQSIHGNSFYIALGQAARAIRAIKSTNVHLK